MGARFAASPSPKVSPKRRPLLPEAMNALAFSIPSPRSEFPAFEFHCEALSFRGLPDAGAVVGRAPLRAAIPPAALTADQGRGGSAPAPTAAVGFTTSARRALARGACG